MMSKLEILLEQSAFLLEKQKEAQKECASIFADFLAMVDKKAKNVSDPEDARGLEKIHELIVEQAKKFDEETQEDVDFLVEQTAMLENVRKISDKEKAKEVMDLMIDEDEELLSTEELKRNVIEEGELSKENLLNMIEDIKEALNEGSIKEVELLLETFVQDQEDLDEECDEDDEDCDCDDCNEDDCSCSSKSGDKAGCCGEVDVFAKFNELAEQAEGNDKKKAK